MPDLDLPQRQATDTLMLTGFWYRALPADRVHRNQLYKATLLEIPLVIGRDRAGQPFALRDACPHRGMPLNCGQFDGENLECPYHGWQFDVHNGQCQLIPSLTSRSDDEDSIASTPAATPAKSSRDSSGSTSPIPARQAQVPANLPKLPTRAASRKVQRQLQTRLPPSRNTGQHRPRHHRAHGSRARPVRSSGLVVAYAA